jgi:NADH-quinone oxidoreductase subunit L
MRNMGGLAKYMPITYAVMTIGTIAITGLGIPGIELGFAGFYSKDAIIHAAYEAGGAGHPMGYFAFTIGILVAGLTAFYSWRVAFFTFNGHARWTPEDLEHHWHNRDHAHGDPVHDEQVAHHAGVEESHSEPDHGDHHHAPHESPWTMRIPLILLALGAVASGFAFHPQFIGAEMGEFWRGAIFHAPVEHAAGAAEHHAPLWVVWAPLVVSVGGLLVAAYMYIWREGLGAKLAANQGLLYVFFYNKWFFDELYDATFVRAARILGDIFWKVGDKKIIDGLGPDGVAAVSVALGKRTGALQSGYVYHYAFVMLLGVAGLLSFAMWAWR